MFHGFTASSFFRAFLIITIIIIIEALSVIFGSVINNAEMDLFGDIFYSFGSPL